MSRLARRAMLAAMQSDGQLLEAWGSGDAAAGDALVERYYNKVLRFFDFRAGAQAEDLAQKTFLTCLERRHTLRELTSFRAFLFGIARNHLLHHIRGRARDSVPQEFDDFASEQPSPSRIVAMYEEQRLLLRALQGASVDAQQILQLYYWEQLQSSEIGAVLGIPVSTVTTRLSRARKGLLDAVSRISSREQDRTSLINDFDRWLASFGGLRVSGAE